MNNPRKSMSGDTLNQCQFPEWPSTILRFAKYLTIRRLNKCQFLTHKLASPRLPFSATSTSNWFYIISFLFSYPMSSLFCKSLLQIELILNGNGINCLLGHGKIFRMQNKMKRSLLFYLLFIVYLFHNK